MKLATYGLGLMLIGIVVGLLLQLLMGLALLAIGAGLLLVSLIGIIDADDARRQEEIDSHADEIRRRQSLF